MTSTSMPDTATLLDAVVDDVMERFHVPGMSVGITYQGREQIVTKGVTNLENPLPVGPDTMFQIGSTTKTFTATVVMQLVEEGNIDLDVPLRTYLPDLRLADEDVANAITVRHLLNHTAGWQSDFPRTDTGRGDEALARVLATLSDIPQVAPLGTLWSYNNTALGVAGRVIEVVTGQTFDVAVRERILEPLRMTRSFFFPEEIMTYSFAVGHLLADETPRVARPSFLPRRAGPSGGLVSSVRDQLTYARFHMGNGTAPDGTQLLSAGTLKTMQTPSVHAFLDTRLGITWWIRDVGGLRQVTHGGATIGQLSAFLMVPERQFAVSVLSNVSPAAALGPVTAWALETYLGVTESPPTPIEVDPDLLSDYLGRYATGASIIDITVEGSGLVMQQLPVEPLPEPMKPPPPSRLAFYQPDRVIALDARTRDARAEFLRDSNGQVTWFHFGARAHRKTSG